MTAPLPYVNLDKYDNGDAADHSHVYVTSSCEGNRSAPCHRCQSYDCINTYMYEKSRREKERAAQGNAIRRRCDSESKVDSAVIREPIYSNEENIYANDYPFKENSPPPELPPKGPSLLRKSAKKHSRYGLPPPIPPGKHRLSLNLSKRASQGQGDNRSGSKSKIYVKPQHPSSCRQLPCSRDPSCGNPRLSLYSTMSDSDNAILRVKLPNESKGTSEEKAHNEPYGYMDMTGMFEDEKQKVSKPNRASEERMLQSKQYVRSHSASSIMDSHSSQSQFGHTCNAVVTPSVPIREENYLLMSDFTSPQKTAVKVDTVSTNSSEVKNSPEVHNLQSHKTDTKKGEWDRPHTAGKSALPFPNLMNFTQNLVPKSSSQSVISSPLKSVQSIHTEKSANDAGGKSPGFLSRLIRRNSGNRKSISQSQENLLASSSSESCLDRAHGAIVHQDSSASNHSDSSASEQSVINQSLSSSQQDCSAVNVRRRSSSFPNRSSFIDMVVKVESTSIRRDPSDACFSEASQDEQKSLLDSDQNAENEISENKFRAESKGYAGPFGCKSEDEKDKMSTGEDNDDDDYKSPKMGAYRNQDMGIFSVLNVSRPRYGLGQGTSKTDDEKMIELLKYQQSQYNASDPESTIGKSDENKLVLTQFMSPTEQAAAIAKHVSSLPPFVPFKQKSYSRSLSPVPESGTSSDSKSMVAHRSNSSLGSVSKADLEAALAKVVTEKENESIWIPRSQSGK